MASAAALAAAAPEAASPLAHAAAKAIEAHGIGAGASQPPARAPELWEAFRARGETEVVQLAVENCFYAGFDHGELDWSRPVHAVFADFKGDGMQMGMLLRRLTLRGDQYVFVGNPLPFNGGWHFTAVDDFEHPAEQEKLDPAWRNIRIWHRVNYVATTTEDGRAALVAREDWRPEQRHVNARPVAEGFRFASLYFVGGLMPHTLNTVAIADGGAAGVVIAKHVELGATLATVGHGLDVPIACGTPERSLVAGFRAAVFPKQDRLLEISGMDKSPEPVSSHVGPTGARLVSASYWGVATAEGWLAAAGLDLPPLGGTPAAGCTSKTLTLRTQEQILRLDVVRMPGMTGAVGGSGASAAGPQVAVFVDEVADPIEIYTIVDHLLLEGLGFRLISRSGDEALAERRVTSETVFGNAMYGLRDCCCSLLTTPASAVPTDVRFDSVFVAGGQCPYHMMQDAAVTAIMDRADIAAAVCHGPEALIGSKWMRTGGSACGRFTAYYGCWVSFRDVLERFQRGKPGETCQDGRLFSGNAPNATAAMVRQACAAIRELRAAGGGGAT